MGTASGTNGTTATASRPRVLPGAAAGDRDREVGERAGREHAASGPVLTPGAPVTWTYVVTNPGTVPLSNVTVTDDNGTPGNIADDFLPTFTGGDTNSDGLLDPGETWTYTATGTVGTTDYCNVGSASGTNGTTVIANDPACYRVPPPVIAIGEVGERSGREHARVGSGVDAGCGGDVDVCGDEPGHGAVVERDRDR